MSSKLHLNTYAFLKKISKKSDKHKVDTFIVGTQKGGTSALFHYLSKSPEVIVSKTKEIGFFTNNHRFNLGVKWYENQFPYYNKIGKRQLDATPEYLYYPNAVKRIHNYNKSAKVIILLRDPVYRAFSHYNMFKNISKSSNSKLEKLKKKWESNYSSSHPIYKLVAEKNFPNFAEIIKEEVENIDSQELEPSFVKRGFYYDQIKPYIDIFPSENVLIVESEYLKENSTKCVKEICSFLDISAEFLNSIKFEKRHIGNYKEKFLESDKESLRKIYTEHNKKLFDLINKKYNWL